VPLPIVADVDLVSHRAFGLPGVGISPEVMETIEDKSVELAQTLGVPVEPGQAYETINRLDGFEPVAGDDSDIQRHQIQFTGQFLMDRDGIVRWVNVECERDGLSGLDLFPSDDELLAAARAL
jgi:hypothetical protein